MSTKHVHIIGAGLAGSLLACYLARQGWRVTVFERRPDPRAAGYAGGRSINLALSVRGLTALAGAGLADTVIQRDAIPMRGRMIHSAAGTLTLQPYSSNPADAINSVSRAGLNLTLIHAAAAMPGVRLFFDSPCSDIDLDAPASIIRTGGVDVRHEADLILGADGAFSPVRGRLQKTDRFEYSQTYLEHGYKELHIPPTGSGEYALDPNALHIWPRGGAMMIALPNRDRSFTCTLFWPFQGEHGLESLRTPAEVRAFFEQHYPDAVPLMPTLEGDYLRNPNGSLVTVRCYPWRHQGKVCILGDAAHAIVPFYGQGMNAAFEDCQALARALGAGDGDLSDALDAFQQSRKPNADAIADMALENFVEMRDKVGSPAFLYRKRVEQAIHRTFPDRVTPQYNLVSFSTVPYSEARRRGRELDRVIDRVVAELPAHAARDMSEAQWTDALRAAAARALDHASSDQPVIDITPAITPSLGVWPGDTPVSREVLCDLEQGANITLSTLRATVHLGAHADGPNHYGRGEPGIGERRLAPYVGPCHVVTARVDRNARVRLQDLACTPECIRHPRVLLRTGSFPSPTNWNTDFAGLSVELVDALAARGVTTIGIDTPSVDLFSSKDLEAHHAILRHDISILEGLVLEGVPDGEYELVALPLKLMGFDASPVRAVLRPLRT